MLVLSLSVLSVLYKKFSITLAEESYCQHMCYGNQLQAKVNI